MVMRCLFICHSNVIQPPAEVRYAEKRSLESADRVIDKFRPVADAHVLPCHCARRPNKKVYVPLTTHAAMCSHVCALLPRCASLAPSPDLPVLKHSPFLTSQHIIKNATKLHGLMYPRMNDRLQSCCSQSNGDTHSHD